MKYILIAAALLIAGCTPASPDNVTTKRSFRLSGELSDCKYMEVDTPAKLLYVIRCPNNVTSTTWNEQQGKQTVTRSVTMVD